MEYGKVARKSNFNSEYNVIQMLSHDDASWDEYKKVFAYYGDVPPEIKNGNVPVMDFEDAQKLVRFLNSLI